MPRSPVFYFGSVIFFLGVLLMAFGVSRAIAQSVDTLAIAELISGVVLILVGSRAVRSAQRWLPAKEQTANMANT